MRRYCQPPNGSTPKASKEVLKLWKSGETGRSLSNAILCILLEPARPEKCILLTNKHILISESISNSMCYYMFLYVTYIAICIPTLGDKLKQLLEKHGSMQTVEIQIQKWQKKVEADGNRGKWVTKGQLIKDHSYDQTLRCLMLYVCDITQLYIQ